MGDKLVGQQLGVRPREKDTLFLPQQTVDKQWPGFYILYLVEEEAIHIAINNIDGLEQFVQVIGLHRRQAFVVEIDKCTIDGIID